MSKGKLITLMGQTMSISSWARKYGIPSSTLICRIRRGMGLKDALFATPHNPMKIRVGNSEQTAKELARILGMDKNSIYTRLRRGWAKNQMASPRLIRKTLTAFGQTKTFGQWANDTGLPLNTIHNRLRAGWTVDETLSLPKFAFGYNRSSSKIEAFGKAQSMTEWARELGIDENTLRTRLYRGVPPEVALKAPGRKAKGE